MNFEHEKYMQRCLDLAVKGSGFVAPNPMVGAVLVYDGRIIGEGYHQQYGQAHAEVNCINSVKEADKQYISLSTLYVSLEPCNHFGKTPPCTNLIIENKIPKVIIGMQDPFKEVNGSGIRRLRDHGVNVELLPSLENECKAMNKRFVVFHRHQRPYIILKWAQTGNGYIGNITDDRLLISNTIVNRWVHKMRAEEAAILIGANTVLKDNPQLNLRHWYGNNPMKMIIDPKLRATSDLRIFNNSEKTIVFNYFKSAVEQNVEYVNIQSENIVDQILKYSYTNNIQSIIVEGGAFTLQRFIDDDFWDETFIVHNDQLIINSGILAPRLQNHRLKDSFYLSDNRIQHFIKNTK